MDPRDGTRRDAPRRDDTTPLGRATLLLAACAVAMTLTGACSAEDDSRSASSDVPTSATPSTTAVVTPLTAPPGAATGGVTVTPNPVPIPGEAATVTVSWEGQEPRTLMFLTVCRRPTADPTFDVAADCSPLSEITPNGTPDGTGTVEMEVFRGPTPDGDGLWGCFAEADEAPPGVQKNTTCYLRVTNDVVLNDDDAREMPFTIVPG